MRAGLWVGWVGLAALACEPDALPIGLREAPDDAAPGCLVARIEAGATGVRGGCGAGPLGGVAEVPLELVAGRPVGGFIVRVADVGGPELVEVRLGADAAAAGKSLSVLREAGGVSIVVAGLNYAALGDADGDGASDVARLRYALPPVEGNVEIPVEIVEVVGPTGVGLMASGYPGRLKVKD